MLHYAIVFLIIALIAAFLGFGSLAGTAALIAKVCFVLFLIFAIVSFLKRGWERNLWKIPTENRPNSLQNASKKLLVRAKTAAGEKFGQSSRGKDEIA
jgi:uncharacterized membrane protein YtjA (UPF0391 family)